MSWKIDPSHSLFEFSVKHMMITTVRGRFKEFAGTLVIDEDNPTEFYAQGEIDVASLDTHDPQRDAHLRSADFFNVEKYPKMTFRSTRIEPLGGDHFKVYGDLTIKDITREVVFDATDEGRMQDPWGKQRWGFNAETRLNRKDFDLTWNVPLEAGGWLVGDEVKISVELQAVREQPEAAEEPAAEERVAA
jgi:polyisoprenoid-binding protein YceI